MDERMFLAKVRIDVDKMAEFGLKLGSGELDRSHIVFTYCLKDDPSVGLSLWNAEDRRHFDRLIAPHAVYYREIIDVQEAVKPEEAMRLILEEMKKGGA